MAKESKIEWTDASWTPIRAKWFDPEKGVERVGWHCEHVTEGCTNCYSESLNHRWGTGLPFKPGHLKHLNKQGVMVGDVDMFLDMKMLLAPLRWTSPKMIFVCSMTDLFGPFVKPEWIDLMFAVMALCPHHTFQVLTKRAGRMRDHALEGPARGAKDWRNRVAWEATLEVMHLWAPKWVKENTTGPHRSRAIQGCTTWPLPNVWLGVSAEDQDAADERLPYLLATPAAKRFVSYEPALGPVNFAPWLADLCPNCLQPGCVPVLRSDSAEVFSMCGKFVMETPHPLLDWIICGGESGPHARPMNPQWARDVRDQCAAAGTAYFFKQWGEWVSVSEVAGPGEHFKFADGRTVRRTGKKLAGRTLDGALHDAMPT